MSREILAARSNFLDSNNSENLQHSSTMSDSSKELLRLQQLEQQLAARERDVARREQELQRMKSEIETDKSNGKSDRTFFKPEVLDEMFPALPRPRPIHSREIEIGPSIGTGKFADVSMGYLRVPCAVKKMRGQATQDNLANFRREAMIMNACNHPNVIKLLGYCSESGKYCLIQELVTGGNLHERMHKKHCHLTYQQVVRVGLQVAEAMVHLHSLNIVHRDIKPHNFVIDNSFEPAKVLLCDFGLARMKSGKYVETDGRVAGTPAYQAPEMLRLQPITEKVDQYSFAILLWEMITCQLPWWGKSFDEMVNCVTRLDERPAIPSDCPELLASVVRECWQPDPELRPSFEVVRQRLRVVSDMLKSVPEFRSKVGPTHAKTGSLSGNNNNNNGNLNGIVTTASTASNAVAPLPSSSSSSLAPLSGPAIPAPGAVLAPSISSSSSSALLSVPKITTTTTTTTSSNPPPLNGIYSAMPSSVSSSTASSARTMYGVGPAGAPLAPPSGSSSTTTSFTTYSSNPSTAIGISSSQGFAPSAAPPGPYDRIGGGGGGGGMDYLGGGGGGNSFVPQGGARPFGGGGGNAVYYL